MTFKLQQARQLRKNLTEAERKLWYWLRRRYVNGFRFRRQVPIGPFIADFLCYEIRLIIEVDGGGHNNAETVYYDQARTSWFEQQGYVVKRFWNNDVLGRTESVLEEIYKCCVLRNAL